MPETTSSPIGNGFLIFYLWVVVPLTLVFVWFYGASIASDIREGRLREAAWTGIVAGLVAFVIYSIILLHKIQPPALLPEGIFAEPKLWWPAPLVAGFLCGFFLLSSLHTRFDSAVVVGFTTLMVSFGSSAALFSYTFRLFTEPLALAVLGGFFGALVYRIFELGRTTVERK